MGILGGGTNLGLPVGPFSLPGILGYDTGDRPFPERGDSATGERLTCVVPGGCSGLSSSDDVLMVVMPLSAEGARGRVRFRPEERFTNMFWGLLGGLENKGLGMASCCASESLKDGSVTTRMDWWFGPGGIGADDERRWEGRLSGIVAAGCFARVLFMTGRIVTLVASFGCALRGVGVVPSSSAVCESRLGSFVVQFEYLLATKYAVVDCGSAETGPQVWPSGEMKDDSCPSSSNSVIVLSRGLFVVLATCRKSSLCGICSFGRTGG